MQRSTNQAVGSYVGYIDIPKNDGSSLNSINFMIIILNCFERPIDMQCSMLDEAVCVLAVLC